MQSLPGFGSLCLAGLHQNVPIGEGPAYTILEAVGCGAWLEEVKLHGDPPKDYNCL